MRSSVSTANRVPGPDCAGHSEIPGSTTTRVQLSLMLIAPATSPIGLASAALSSAGTDAPGAASGLVPATDSVVEYVRRCRFSFLIV